MAESTSSSSNAHREHAAEDAQIIRCAILTISDTRTPDTDKGGQLIRDLLNDVTPRVYDVADYTIVRDDADAISSQLDEWIARPDVHVILTTGGTGIARRDTTIEVVDRKLSAKLDGFGELFRMLSWDEVQSAAMLSRATAGLIAREEAQGGDTFIFSMPGSTNAVRLAMEKLIIPELPHLIWERKR